MTILRYSAASHVGLRRKINEDSILSLPGHRIWIVSDGMGGHEAGDFASQTVTETIAALPPDLSPVDAMQALRCAILQSHDLIRAEALRRGNAVIGATVVALLMANSHFVAFWAGDSRLYRLRDGEIELLTADHSLAGELVAAGALSWDEAESHPQANMITRAVGVGDELELDKLRGDVRRGDRFLLCSDGLPKYAGFETLRRAVTGKPLETVCDGLIQIALAGGGADNISVIVIDCL